MQVGRPPHIPAGSTQLAQSMVLVQADLSHFGGYRVVVRAKGPDGEELVKTLPFGLVRHGPGTLPPPPTG
jgi:protein-S-isoprenylcysteine O-methyltransferase Ste14